MEGEGKDRPVVMKYEVLLRPFDLEWDGKVYFGNDVIGGSIGPVGQVLQSAYHTIQFDAPIGACWEAVIKLVSR
jgi:hypothetical protein